MTGCQNILLVYSYDDSDINGSGISGVEDLMLTVLPFWKLRVSMVRPVTG